MSRSIRKGVVVVAALAAAALGASALANAASSGSSTTQGSNSAQTPYGAPAANGNQQPPSGAPAGPHVGANGKQEEALTGETAAKVKAAALKKVDGTVLRVETDVDHGSPYEAHVRKADGTEVEVLVNKDFEVTAVNTMRQR